MGIVRLKEMIELINHVWLNDLYAWALQFQKPEMATW
jgi:hypothetical protein